MEAWTLLQTQQIPVVAAKPIFLITHFTWLFKDLAGWKTDSQPQPQLSISNSAFYSFLHIVIGWLVTWSFELRGKSVCYGRQLAETVSDDEREEKRASFSFALRPDFLLLSSFSEIHKQKCNTILSHMPTRTNNLHQPMKNMINNKESTRSTWLRCAWSL